MSTKTFVRYKFCATTNKEFAATLKERVNNYFKENGLETHGNTSMIVKSCLAFTCYFAIYGAIVFGGFTNIGVLFALWSALGIGAAVIGTAVMHDALHGTFSKNKVINKIMSFSAAMLGVNGEMWKIQHNVLHHSYTNIESMDTDIDTNNILRFSPHQPRNWYHKFQLLYAPFLYGIMTLTWVAFKDFVDAVRYRNLGLIRSKKQFSKEMWKNVLIKVLYFLVFLAIPAYALPVPFWMTLLMFVAMHFVLGVFLSVVFQTAHVMPTTHFEPEPMEPKIHENWLVHQILTTSNFAMKNKALSWVIGGLNYQVEHHLFPNVSHIHYPKLAKIVEQTTKEFNLPYYYHKTFAGAIVRHFQHIYNLSKNPNKQALAGA